MRRKPCSQFQVADPLERLSKEDLQRKTNISRVMTETLRYLSNELVRQDFEWLLPVVFSKTTDPLWPDPGASIEKRVEVEIYGETVRTTTSMIIHKIVSCSLAYPKLFVISPNVRIEKRERQSYGLARIRVHTIRLRGAKRLHRSISGTWSRDGSPD